MSGARGDSLVDETEELYCYGHPKTPTRLRCSRCERPICGRCAVPASVGQHCPECVAEARRTTRKARSVLAATAPVIRAIVIVNVVVYVAQTLIPVLLPYFAMRPLDVEAGQFYRLVTAFFLHAPLGQPFGLVHIVFNMAALSIYGPHVEQGYGSRKLLVMYLVAGFAASAASYAFNECNASSVGASGAVFGILGALTVLLYNRRRSQLVREYLRGIGALIAINLVFGFVVGFIDNFAHIGGLVAGAVMGAGLDRAEGRSAGAGVLAVALTLLAAVALIAWRTATFTCPVGA